MPKVAIKTENRVTVDAEVFAALSSEALRFCPNRPTLPMLSNVLLEAGEGRLSLTSTDLVAMYRSDLEYEGEGSLAVPAKMLSDTLARASGPVSLTFAPRKTLLVEWIGVRTEIKGEDGDEFPVRDLFAGDVLATVPLAAFQRVVERVTPATATDKGRIVLTGCHLSDGFTLTATDGNRMARDSANVEFTGNLVLPAKPLREAARMLDDQVTVSRIREGIICFSDGTRAIAIREIEGSFPNADAVIPTGKSTTNVRIDRERLIRALSLATTYADQPVGGRYVASLSVEPGELVIRGTRAERGTSMERVECETEGSLVFHINTAIVLDLLGAIEEKEITLEPHGPLSPCVIRVVGDKRYIALVMPLRIPT